MPEMTVAEAAKWAGKGKPAIFKALQKGQLSGRRDDKGQWWIDPAELERVYTPGTTGTSDQTAKELPRETGQELALMRELVDTHRREAEEARQERDAWKAQAAKWQEEAAAVRLLVAPAKDAAAPAPAQRGLRQRFGQLFGGR